MPGSFSACNRAFSVAVDGRQTEAGIAEVQDAEGKGAQRVAFFKDLDGSILAIAGHR